MNIRIVRVLLRIGLFVALASASLTSGRPRQAPSRSGRMPAAAANRALSQALIPGSTDLQLVVELPDPSVSEWLRSAPGNAPQASPDSSRMPVRTDFRSESAKSYRARVNAAQRLLAEELLRLPGTTVQGRIDTVMNAIFLRVPAVHFQEIATKPGVKRVYLSRAQRMLLDTSASLLDAPALWNRVGGRDKAGSGVKIGIIDTGIDNTNPMFVDSSMVPPAGFPMGESAFTNSKVIVARNYVNLLFQDQPVKSALDEVGHGTFVAGCAAGRTVAAPLATISGLAPGAYLGSYKVFGTPGVNDFTSTAAVLAAIDSAVEDGMDVLNLSLGSLDYTPPSEDPEVTAIENAVASGVVVVIAAGNDGPGTQTIGSPGTAPDAITVGAVSNARTFASHVHVTAPAPVPPDLQNIWYVPGDGPAISAPIAPNRVADVAALDGSGEACSPLPTGSLKGSIALILRKPCTFVTKVSNAAAAGAVGVIIYNNSPTEGPVSMAGLGTTTIPSLMISNADGTAIKQLLTARRGNVLAGIDSNQMLTSTPTPARVVASFSSAGPGMDFGIKPELLAVGENVYSAAQRSNSKGAIYSPSGFTLGQGTSFSSPMVAGAAADLRQLFPALDPGEIKSALVNTASWDVAVDGATSPDILRAGNGLLDSGRVAAVGAVFSPVTLSFGARAYSGTISLSKVLTIRNISSTPDQYVLQVDSLVAGPAITLAQNATPVVPSGSTTAVEVSIRADSPQTGGFQGFVTITSRGTGAAYRVPYWAGLYVHDPSRLLTVTQNPSGQDSFPALADALAAARPGNIVEIADSRTYPAGLTISTNREGLPLNGITLRARAGQTPTIDGSTAITSFGDIRVIGLRSVLLQGLNVQGGLDGIVLSQASTSVPLSVTIDRCTVAGNSGAGIVAFSGAAVEIVNSLISDSSGPGIFALGGTLTLAGSTVQNNATDGIDAVGVNVDVLNSTFKGNTGVGLNVFGSYGTIDGSTFSFNTGPAGDGVDIVDGNFTITGNIFEANERAGIAFLAGSETNSGPVASVLGNTARNNKVFGILASPGQSLVLDGNLIEGNGSGFRFEGYTSASLVNNIILRSTDSTSGDGISVVGQSKVRIVNDTVYGNAGHGIALATGASVSVFNSIVNSNRAGDLAGLGVPAVQFSLMGDASAGGGSNRSGDPMFTDPVHGDFSLRSGSPARGAGKVDLADLPFLDFQKKLRASGATEQEQDNSESRVDLGAIQSDSFYPLSYPLFANGEHPLLGNAVVTGLAVLNNSDARAIAHFRAYDPAGHLLASASDPSEETLAPAAQLPILGYQLFGLDSGAPVLGSILARSIERMTGFFLLFDPDFIRFAAGVGVSGQTAKDIVYMEHQSGISTGTRYVLSNPGINPARVTAALYSDGGALAGTPKTAVVAPKGQFIFDFDNDPVAAGFVHLTSDQPVTGLELFGRPNQITALAAGVPGSEARLFLPHIAVNNGFSTVIGAVNPSPFPVNIIVTAYDDGGIVMGTPAQILLNGYSRLYQSVTSLFGLGSASMPSGYVVVQSNQAGVVGFTTFSHDDGTHKSTTSLPADSVPHRRLIFSHVAHQIPAPAGRTYQTGVALLNPFGTTVPYTMSVYDRRGVLVAQGGATLGPHQKVSKFLSHSSPGAGYFSQPLPLQGGHIEVTSDWGLFGLELFFTEDFSQLTGVSAQIP